MFRFTAFSFFLLTFVAPGFNAFATPDNSLPEVTLIKAQLETDRVRIAIPGRVEPLIQSHVVAEVEGHIKKIVKTLGSTVKRGEVVLYMENKVPGFTYAAIPVRSPVSGSLSQLQASVLSRVTAGDRLFTVVEPRRTKVMVEIPAGDLASIKIGDWGEFTLSNTSNKSWNVVVRGLSPALDPRTGTATAELEWTKDNSLAPPPIGEIGRVTFELKRMPTLSVPEDAVSYSEGKPFVRLIENGSIVRKRSIVVGEPVEGYFVVEKGLKPGEKIVVRSTRPLKEGEKVKVEQELE